MPGFEKIVWGGGGGGGVGKGEALAHARERVKHWLMQGDYVLG